MFRFSHIAKGRPLFYLLIIIYLRQNVKWFSTLFEGSSLRPRAKLMIFFTVCSVISYIFKSIFWPLSCEHYNQNTIYSIFQYRFGIILSRYCVHPSTPKNVKCAICTKIHAKKRFKKTKQRFHRQLTNFFKFNFFMNFSDKKTPRPIGRGV